MLHTAKITTLAELEQFCTDVRAALRTEGRAKTGFTSQSAAAGDCVYVGGLRLSLAAEKLTDGSTVYNITPALVL